jgi:hypothetical protein
MVEMEPLAAQQQPATDRTRPADRGGDHAGADPSPASSGRPFRARSDVAGLALPSAERHLRGCGGTGEG